MLEYKVIGKYAEIVGATPDETIINIPKKIDDFIVEYKTNPSKLIPYFSSPSLNFSKSSAIIPNEFEISLPIAKKS